VLSTGDEIVDVTATPGPNQIRNSNGTSLAAQATRAGAEVVLAEKVGDDRQVLRQAIERAREVAEVILLSGGVSMGKYDLVEDVLAGLGGATVFDGAAIRPGKPVVFGRLGAGFFFGLPGNPLSTMVTFELFARPALEALAGATPRPLRLTSARLAEPIPGKPLPLTLFLPAVLEGDDGAIARVRTLPSQGSGDLVALARADVFVVLPPDAGAIPAGTEVSVLPR
jgi:molybdopterin molybdotransferase